MADTLQFNKLDEIFGNSRVFVLNYGEITYYQNIKKLYITFLKPIAECKFLPFMQTILFLFIQQII